MGGDILERWGVSMTSVYLASNLSFLVMAQDEVNHPASIGLLGLLPSSLLSLQLTRRPAANKQAGGSGGSPQVMPGRLAYCH